MTKDVISLTPLMPDPWALLAGLYAGGPGMEVASVAEGAVVQLSGVGGRPLVSVEAPILVQVPGEASRLLGIQPPVDEGPFWWTETRASTAVPEAARLAGSFCGRLNLLLGGVTWPPGAATTEVVETPSDVCAVPVPEGTGMPAVDVLTHRSAVVLTDRPVIALTPWLSDVFRSAVATERSLQIVSPATARLTAPARAVLAQPPNRWVVQDPGCGYYDGLTGAVLSWQDGTFAPVLTDGSAGRAETFTAHMQDDGRRLIVAFRTLRSAAEDLVLGQSLEAAWQILTGTAPVGWGTAEPVNLPWSPRQLTELARDRAPEPTQFVAVGSPDRSWSAAWVSVSWGRFPRLPPCSCTPRSGRFSRRSRSCRSRAWT